MENYKDFAISLALKSGNIMRKNFKVGMHKEWKKDNSPVTETDIAINDLVIKEASKHFPSHGVLGEEASYFNGEEYVWVCDPVDGTNPFSRGYPLFTFSLALVRNGHPILGLIYDPMLDRLLIAEYGKGTHVNNQLVRVSESLSLSRSVVAIESNNPRFEKLRRYLAKEGCLITSFACVTYSSLLVAIGEFAAVIWEGKTAWDGAAVQIIIDEAGGTCTDILGSVQRYDGEINGLVASNKKIHSQLLKLING